MITPVCQSFWCFSKFTPIDIPLSTNILFLCSMPSTFQFNFILTNTFLEFQSLYGCCTFNVTTSSFPKSIVLDVLVGIALLGLTNHFKYSLYHEMISFSSLRMLPVESLMEVVAVKLSHAFSKWSAKILC